MISKEAKVGMEIFKITYFIHREIAKYTIYKIEENKVRLIGKDGNKRTLGLSDLWGWDKSFKEAIDTAIQNNQDGIKEAESNIKAQRGEIEELRKMKLGLI